MGAVYATYAITPDGSLPPQHFRISVRPLWADPRTFTCDLHTEDGTRVYQVRACEQPFVTPEIPLSLLTGAEALFRLNYAGGSAPDILVPVKLPDELDGNEVAFVWSTNVTTLDGRNQPLVQLDPQGAPLMLSYDVPEPTSYRGRHVIELDLPEELFRQPQQLEGRAVPPGFEPGSPIDYGQDPLIGGATPVRGGEEELTEESIRTAFEFAKLSGYFNPMVFPNVKAGHDDFSRANVRAAIADLDTGTVVAQLRAGNRLTVYRTSSGAYAYRFIPKPAPARPRLLLVEYYRLSSFPARYGAGRTIKTFSLLPGERTKIRISTFKRSTESMQRATSIVDSTSDETEGEFERSVLAEQSGTGNSTSSFEYHAEAEAQVSASWGWGNASGEVSGGVRGSTNLAREEFAKNVSNAVSHNAARASSRRDVQVDTSLDVKLESGEEQAIERELANINVSRTLNFVFRQMNQEYLSLLHLVDVRVAFFNGYAESRFEAPLNELDKLLERYVEEASRQQARDAVLREVQGIRDYSDATRDDFVEHRTLDGQATYPRVNPGCVSSYQVAQDAPVIRVPGVILAVDTHVMRTDGVVVDTFLGAGNALDVYANGLQEQAIRERSADNARKEAEVERMRLATEVVRSGDATRAALFQQLFPPPQIVNQIEQATVGRYETP